MTIRDQIEDIRKIAEAALTKIENDIKSTAPAETADQVAVRKFLRDNLYADWHTKPWDRIVSHWPNLVKNLRTYRRAVMDEAIQELGEDGYGWPYNRLKALKEKGV